MLCGAFLALVCGLSLATAQPLVSESVFKQLSAEELRDLELAQSPELLALAARTGERVEVIISGPSQGAVVQDGVNTVLNCLPWLQNFPGGEIRWYLYAYTDVDHTMLGPRTAQLREDLVTNVRKNIEGDYDEIYNITRTRIQDDAADPTRGIFECEVCIEKGTIFEECHSANTSVIIAGREPLLNSTTGRIPDIMDTLGNREYRIGATICIEIHPTDPFALNQQDINLRCPITPADVELNIPPANPVPTRVWTHTSLDGRTATLGAVDGLASAEFVMEFPRLTDDNILRFIIDTASPEDALIFNIGELIKNTSSEDYLSIQEGFGTWTCTLNNSLGTESATTFFSDMCGMAPIPSILRRDCSMAGTLIGSDLATVVRGQPSSIPIGCDVCVKESEEVWLTIVCPTNAGSFPNVSVTITWEDENGVELMGNGDTLLVQVPGTYTCIADFGGGEVVRESTDIGFLPSADITYKLNGVATNGCDRLKENTFTPSDVCAFLGETLDLLCEPGLENVTGIIQPGGVNPFNATVSLSDENVYTCSLSATDASDRCVSVTGDAINVRVFDPAKITPPIGCPEDDRAAGQSYGLNSVGVGVPVVLCCSTKGTPEPNNTWSRIVTDPATGLITEQLLPAGDPNIDIDADTNTLTFITYNTSYDGTYICKTSNIAGSDAGTVSITSVSDTPVWITSEWSECEPKCLNGTRTRRVECRSSLNNRVLPNSDCDCNNIPAESELCINIPDLPRCFMLPLWKTGEFGRCSRGCSGGYRLRPVQCAIPFDGKVVPDEDCRKLYGYMPLGIDFCYNRCCYRDVYPVYCRYFGGNRCKDAIYQQNCCWTCGRANIP